MENMLGKSYSRTSELLMQRCKPPNRLFSLAGCMRSRTFSLQLMLYHNNGDADEDEGVGKHIVVTMTTTVLSCIQKCNNSAVLAAACDILFFLFRHSCAL